MEYLKKHIWRVRKSGIEIKKKKDSSTMAYNQIYDVDPNDNRLTIRYAYGERLSA